MWFNRQAQSLGSLRSVHEHRWRATLFRPKATPRSSSRRVFLIQMHTLLPMLILLMSMQTWLFPSSLALRSSRAVHTQPQERRRKTEVRAREKQTRRQKDNTRASDSNHVTQASPDHHDQEKRAESRDKREESSSHGDTPILIQTWFSHLNACPGQAAATEARSEKRETRSPKWMPEIHKLSDSKVC